MERIIEMNWFALAPHTESSALDSARADRIELVEEDEDGIELTRTACSAITELDPRVASVAREKDTELNGNVNWCVRLVLRPGAVL